MREKNKKEIQNKEYDFPYHYIPTFRNGFSQSLNWPWGINYAATIEFLLREIEKINASSIADVGTGDGRLVREIVDKFPLKSVVGIENSRRAISLAKSLNPKLNFVHTDISTKPPQKEFDLVLLIEVLEHISPIKLQKFISSLAAMIKDKGILIMTVPHENKLLQKKHYQHFTLSKIDKLFSDFFTVQHVIYLEKTSKLAYLIHQLLSNKLFILNNQSLKNFLYKFYKKYCFFAQQDNCGRIYVKLINKY